MVDMVQSSHEAKKSSTIINRALPRGHEQHSGNNESSKARGAQHGALPELAGTAIPKSAGRFDNGTMVAGNKTTPRTSQTKCTLAFG